jgi:CAAX protease family protein
LTAPLPSSAPRLQLNARTPKTRLFRFLLAFGLIVAFLVLSIAIYPVLELAAFRIAGVRPVGSSSDPTGVRDILIQWVMLACTVIATYVMLRLIEKLPWSAVGLDRAAASPRILLKGASFGVFTIGLPSLILLGFHHLQIEPNVPGSSLGVAERMTVILLPAAFLEELLFRGYLFSVLRRAAGWKTALIITSIAFGLIHAGNPGADAAALLAVVVAGFFLGLIFLTTRSLYAAGLAHFAWNWVMAVALHIQVSGISSPNPDYRTVETGPDWLTGGPWGPEAGVASVVAMFVVIFYLYGRYLRRMEWKA